MNRPECRRRTWRDRVRVPFGTFFADDFRQLLGDTRGSVFIYATMAASVFVGFSALAIDGSYLYLMKNQAQTAADAAALSGAALLPDAAGATTAAVEFAGKNLTADDHGTVLDASDIEFGNWDSDGRVFAEGVPPTNAIRVTVRMSDDNANPVELYFAGLLGQAEAGVTVSAVAINGGLAPGLGDACLHAMEPSDADAFRVVGTANIYGSGCNIQIDSCHATDALNASGSPDIDLTVELDGGGIGSGELQVCGGISATRNVSLPPAQYVHENTGLSTGDPFDRAPFDSLPAAEETAECDNTGFSRSGAATLWPGVYCGGIELTGNGTATLQPGTYYIKDGAFTVTGNRALYGDGVTFVLVGSAANLALGGVSSMALAAPATGDYAGFVFFGDRDNPATATHKFHGTPLGGFNGIGYFPGAAIEFLGTANAGNAPGTDDCSVLIADTMFFNGTVDLHLATECSDYRDTPAFVAPAATARLVD